MGGGAVTDTHDDHYIPCPLHGWGLIAHHITLSS